MSSKPKQEAFSDQDTCTKLRILQPRNILYIFVKKKNLNKINFSKWDRLFPYVEVSESTSHVKEFSILTEILNSSESMVAVCRDKERPNHK